MLTFSTPRVYTFGAGGSLASQNNEYSLASSSRAPLINELFDGRYQDLSLYMFSSSELDVFRKEIESRQDKSVEEWLEERWTKIEQIKSISRKNSEIRLFGRKVMYVWNVLRTVSNTYNEKNLYRLFLENLYSNNDEDFGIVNFNYDTLLDRAYEQVFHKSFTRIDDYIGENFIKPHGSINWLLEKRESDPGMPTNHDIATRINMAMDQFFMQGAIHIDRLRVLRPPIEQLRHPDIARVWSELGMEYFYPLIFLPLAKKKLDHFTNFYEHVIEKGKEMLSKADEIYVIGYRAKDDIIKELFKHAPDGTVLHVVSDLHAKEISDDILNWAKNLQKGSELNGGFFTFNNSHFNKPGQF